MADRSKRYRKEREQVDRTRRYSVVDAVALLKRVTKTKFDHV